MAAVVRLISPFPPTDVRERIAGQATSKPLLGHWGFARPQGVLGMGRWMRLRADQGVRALSVADDEVVLEQWTQFMARLAVDRCRIQLTLWEPGGGQEPSSGETVLACQFFVPAARQAAKVLIGLIMLAFGLGLTIGIIRDTGASADGKVLLLLFGGAMAIVGVLGISGARPRARLSQQYILSWLERVAAARRIDPARD